MYYKQKGLGIGFFNKEIYGNGIFTDTMKMLGKIQRMNSEILFIKIKKQFKKLVKIS